MSAVTVLYGTRPPAEVTALASGDDLWVPAKSLPEATGWALTPEGLCRADVCIPAPPDTPLRSGDDVNLVALAKLLGQPVIRDRAHDVWSFGETAPGPRAPREALDAPDFTLPDLDGRAHALRDYRGKKVFLVSWASW